MRILIFLVFFLALFANKVADAAEASGTLTWQGPTFYVNGDPLDSATEIDYYTIYFGNSTQNYDIGQIQVPNGATQSHTFTLDIPGTWQDGDTISMHVAMTATVNNNPAVNPAWDGSTSAYSNELVRSFLVTVFTSVPGAPTLISVDITITCDAADGVTCQITVQP